MQTLIELYDERPLENVLSTEMFRPARTVFLCPPEIARSAVLQRRLRQYFAHRGVRCECVFIAVSMTDTAGIAATLSDITEKLFLRYSNISECQWRMSITTSLHHFRTRQKIHSVRIFLKYFNVLSECFF